MATFLELAQAVARDSGTVSNVPSAVTGQSGRSDMFVRWTAEAWTIIQNLRDDWRWMRATFSGGLLASTQEYDAAALGIDADRFSRWVHYNGRGRESFTLYLTASGRADERFLEFMPWEDFRDTYMFGSAATRTGYPAKVTETPQQKLAFYPIPDASYTLRGEYVKAPQTLTSGDDIPEMPARHHNAIKWQALILMGLYDEAFEQMPVWQMLLQQQISQMVSSQTPRIQMAEALA